MNTRGDGNAPDSGYTRPAVTPRILLLLARATIHALTGRAICRSSVPRVSESQPRAHRHDYPRRHESATAKRVVVALASMAIVLVEMPAIACRDYSQYFHWEGSFCREDNSPFIALDAHNGIVVAASLDGTLSTIDVANVEQPRFVGEFASGELVRSVEFVGGIAAVLSTSSVGRNFLTTFKVPPQGDPIAIAKLDVGAYNTEILAIAGNYIMLNGYPGAVDVSDVAKPQFVESYLGPESMCVSDNVAYCLYRDLLIIYDIADITKPTVLSTLELAAGAERSQMVQRGGTLYVATEGHALYELVLYAIDVSDPASPAMLASREYNGLEISLSPLDKYLVVSHFSGVDFLDVSSPEQMVVHYSAPLGTIAGKLRSDKNVIFMTYGAGIVIFGSEHLEDPPLDAKLRVDAGTIGIASDAATAVAYGTGCSQIINLANAAAPVIAAKVDNLEGETVVAAAVQDDVMYLGCNDEHGHGTIRAYKLAPIDRPTAIGQVRIQDGVVSLAARGTLLYVAGAGNVGGSSWSGLAIIDFGEPIAPHVLSIVNDNAIKGSVLEVKDGRVFVDREDDQFGYGIFVYSVDNPAIPERLADIPTPQWVSGLGVVGTQLHVSMNMGRVASYDLSDIRNPQQQAYAYIGIDGPVVAAEHTLFVGGTVGTAVVEMLDRPAPTISGHLWSSSDQLHVSAVALADDSRSLLALEHTEGVPSIAIYAVDCVGIEPPQPDFNAIEIRVIARGSPGRAIGVELFACDSMEIGPFTDCAGSDPSYFRTVESGSSAVFSSSELNTPRDYQGRHSIRRIYLSSATGAPLGEIGFVYPRYYQRERIAKHAVVFVHDDLVSYQEHPIERDNLDWERLKYWRGRTEALAEGSRTYPVSMLIPPFRAASDDPEVSGSFDVVHARPNARPVLLVHGLYGTDMYWGTEREDFDYANDSVGGQINRYMEVGAEPIDVWEFYYPGDQDWLESGVLLERAVRYLHETVGYSSPVAIVAHSMGGVVTRSYIENKARAFVGSVEIAAQFEPNQVDHVIFLGTPQHGSFGGNRAFGEYWYNEYAPLLGQQQDPEAPAIRELGIGSSSMMRLNAPVRSGLPLRPDGVTYAQISGTTHFGLVPDFLGAIIKESDENSDGIVSASSGSLMRIAGESGDRVPLTFLRDFCHAGLKDPSLFLFADRGRPDLRRLLDAGRPLDTYIGRIVADLIGGRSISLPASEYVQVDGSIAGLLSLPAEIPLAVSPGRHRYDVGLPILTIRDEGGRAWRPGAMSTVGARPARLYVGDVEYDDDGKPEAVELVFQHLSSSAQIKFSPNRLTMLYAGNVFQGVWDNGSYDQKQRLSYQRTAFFGYQDDDWLLAGRTPLSTNGNAVHVGEGCGWSIPDNLVLNLGVIVSAVARDARGVPVRVRLGRLGPDEQIGIQRATTTYSDIRVPAAILRCFDTGRLSAVISSDEASGKRTNAASSMIVVDGDTPRITVVANDLSSDTDVFARAPDATTIDLRRCSTCDRYEDLEAGVGIYVVDTHVAGAWEVHTATAGVDAPGPTVFIGLERHHDVQVAYEFKDGERRDIVVTARLTGEYDNCEVLDGAGRIGAMDGTTIHTQFMLRDDGTYPDRVAGDRVYSADVSLAATDNVFVEASFRIAIGDEVVVRSDATEMLMEADGVPAIGRLIVSAYPNPFNPWTRLVVQIQQPGIVDLDIYDVLGRKVRSISSEYRTAGTHEYSWDGVADNGMAVPSGVYLWQVRATGHRDSKKIALIR